MNIWMKWIDVSYFWYFLSFYCLILSQIFFVPSHGLHPLKSLKNNYENWKKILLIWLRKWRIKIWMYTERSAGSGWGRSKAWIKIKPKQYQGETKFSITLERIKSLKQPLHSLVRLSLGCQFGCSCERRVAGVRAPLSSLIFHKTNWHLRPSGSPRESWMHTPKSFRFAMIP